MTDEELINLYDELIPEDMSFEEASDKFESISDHPQIDALRRMLCNGMLYVFSGGYTQYDKRYFKKMILCNFLIKMLRCFRKNTTIIMPCPVF